MSCSKRDLFIYDYLLCESNRTLNSTTTTITTTTTTTTTTDTSNIFYWNVRQEPPELRGVCQGIYFNCITTGTNVQVVLGFVPVVSAFRLNFPPICICIKKTQNYCLQMRFWTGKCRKMHDNYDIKKVARKLGKKHVRPWKGMTLFSSEQSTKICSGVCFRDTKTIIGKRWSWICANTGDDFIEKATEQLRVGLDICRNKAYTCPMSEKRLKHFCNI